MAREKAAVKQSKSDQTRERIVRAAAKVVGSIGYAKASVTRITAEAKLASGGFYYYFKTREELFDQLLPALGNEMIAFISDRLGTGGWGIERETDSFSAYLEFLKEKPEFYRVFSEAYVYAPRAYRRHFKKAVENYREALLIQKGKGFLDITEDEANLLAYFLIGVRNYVSQLYMERNGKIDRDIEPAVALYRQLISNGVFRPADAKQRTAEPESKHNAKDVRAKRPLLPGSR